MENHTADPPEDTRRAKAVFVFFIWGVAIFLSIAIWGGQIQGIRPPADWGRPVAGDVLDIEAQ